MNAIEILIDSSQGIYIPKTFAIHFYPAEGWSGVEENTLDILRSGPDHYWYWDAWESVLDHASFTSKDGGVYGLHQDEDLFAVDHDRLSEAEYQDFFGESGRI